MSALTRCYRLVFIMVLTNKLTGCNNRPFSLWRHFIFATNNYQSPLVLLSVSSVGVTKFKCKRKTKMNYLMVVVVKWCHNEDGPLPVNINRFTGTGPPIYTCYICIPVCIVQLQRHNLLLEVYAFLLHLFLTYLK